MLADFGDSSCSLLLAILDTYFGNAIWWTKANLQHDGVNSILLVEYGHCTVKQMYENVSNNVVKVTNVL
jgi:hypothetical protein